MKDYKSRPKGRKPARRSQSAHRGGRPQALPKGFKPLTAPPSARPERPSRPRRALALLRAAPRLPLRRVVFCAALLWLLAGLAAGGVALWQAPLEEVQLAGNDGVASETVLRQGGLVAGLPMHRVDPYELARRLAAHPRVLSADVRRLYPGRVAIRMQERRAELRIRMRNGDIAVLDSYNVVLDVLPRGQVGSADVRALPLIAGLAGRPGLNQAVHDLAVERGRAALVALRELGFTQAGPVAIDGGDPFLLTLHLPAAPRLIVPHERLETALRTYRMLTEQAPQLLEGQGAVDLAALDEAGGGRVYLRRP